MLFYLILYLNKLLKFTTTRICNCIKFKILNISISTKKKCAQKKIIYKLPTSIIYFRLMYPAIVDNQSLLTDYVIIKN